MDFEEQLAALPKTGRWVMSRKKLLITLVQSFPTRREEILSHVGMSEDEFQVMESRLASGGDAALKVNSVDAHRRPYKKAW